MEARRAASAAVAAPDEQQSLLPRGASVSPRFVGGVAVQVTLHQTHPGTVGFAQPERQQDKQCKHDGDLRIGGVGKKIHQLLPLFVPGQPAVDLKNSPRREPDQGNQDRDAGKGTFGVCEMFHVQSEAKDGPAGVHQSPASRMAE